MTFFLAMVLFPGVQERAQAELDTVVGTDRLPDFSDRNQLPYIAALIKEVWRWQPVAPLGERVACELSARRRLRCLSSSSSRRSL